MAMARIQLPHILAHIVAHIVQVHRAAVHQVVAAHQAATHRLTYVRYAAVMANVIAAMALDTELTIRLALALIISTNVAYAAVMGNVHVAKAQEEFK